MQFDLTARFQFVDAILHAQFLGLRLHPSQHCLAEHYSSQDSQRQAGTPLPVCGVRLVIMLVDEGLRRAEDGDPKCDSFGTRAGRRSGGA